MTAPWIEARFVERPNRFLIRATVGRRTVEAYLANSSRLGELLLPGARLRVVPAEGEQRSTRYDALAVWKGGEWVCLDTRLSNLAVAEALRVRILPEFARFRSVRAEARWRESRFDFLLQNPGRCWLEVKTCSLLRGRRAVFPDAPTARGTRHVSHLAELAARGDAAALLILVLRRAERFSPNDETDPEFVRALRSAKEAGVDIIARRAHLRGLRLEVDRRIPIDLSRGGR